MQEISSGTTEHRRHKIGLPDITPFREVCRAGPWMVTINFDIAVTDTGAPWEPLPNPRAGLEEERWLEQNLDQLRNYRGLWIAILNHSIAASDDSFEDLHRQIVARNIVDALVVKVPDDLTQRDYLIA
jgi:hypothetical protein